MAIGSNDSAAPPADAGDPPSASPPPAPIKDPNPPDAQAGQPAPEIPKVGSRDAPGG